MTAAQLNWTLPTARTDGSALAPSDIEEVDIFDAVNGAAAAKIGTAPGAATSFITPALAGGTHIFTVEVVDTAGDDSQPSSAASLAVPVAPPNPATGLTAVVIPGS